MGGVNAEKSQEKVRTHCYPQDTGLYLLNSAIVIGVQIVEKLLCLRARKAKILMTQRDQGGTGDGRRGGGKAEKLTSMRAANCCCWSSSVPSAYVSRTSRVNFSTTCCFGSMVSAMCTEPIMASDVDRVTSPLCPSSPSTFTSISASRWPKGAVEGGELLVAAAATYYGIIQGLL